MTEQDFIITLCNQIPLKRFHFVRTDKTISLPLRERRWGRFFPGRFEQSPGALLRRRTGGRTFWPGASHLQNSLPGPRRRLQRCQSEPETRSNCFCFF